MKAILYGIMLILLVGIEPVSTADYICLIAGVAISITGLFSKERES